jgi:hypothetical protein
VRRKVRVTTVDKWESVDWNKIEQGSSGQTLLVSSLKDIPENANAPPSGAQRRKYLIFLEKMPIESISTRIPRLNVRDFHRLHLARESTSEEIAAILKRAISGLAIRQIHDRIVDAWVEGTNKLLVLSPTFDRLTVSIDDLRQYLGSNLESIKQFEIDEDGSFLYWPHADVHLGWKQLEGIIDPTTLVSAKQRSSIFNRRYGAAIRALRKERGLKQADITEVTDRHMRRVEKGEIAASSAVLTKLADAHKMKLADYLRELANLL